MFRRYGKKSRGQALIEYALLLMIAVLVSTMYFQLDGTLKDKLLIIASDLVQETPGVPYEVPPIKEKENLSSPVADFYVPEPNYKGRDIRLVNRSFDTDGVIEHYIWNVNGVEYRQSRFDAELDEGLVVNFRYSGTYTATLIVIDNDGLVSNKVTKTIRVINRFPTLDMTAQNELGDIVGMGGTLRVYEGCSARFQTYYKDPDMPYEELTLYTRFTDHSGVVSTYNTVENDFVRTFFNAGRSEYYVEIRDEDNAVASGRIYVNVVENPNPNGSCGNIVVENKPKYRIEVSGYAEKDETKNPRVYYFLPGTKAQLTAVVEWAQHPAHSTPHYWSTTSYPNTQNEWMNRQTIERPYTKVFEIGDAPYTVTGMARDASATSTEPNPNLRGMSNKDSVRLEVFCKPGVASCEVPPTPVITVHNVPDTRTPPAGTVLELPVGKRHNTNFPYNNGAYTLTINSRDSKSNTGGSIAGVRLFIPDASGGKWYPVDNNPANNFGNGNAVKITDYKGNEQWWFPLTPDSPDTLGGKTFKMGEGPQGGLKNEWTYRLHVIDTNGIPSKDPAVKTIRLVEAKDPPTAVCTYGSGNPAKMKKGKDIGNALTASQSKDAEGGTDGVMARWKLPNGSWSEWQARTSPPPSSMLQGLGEGQHQIQLQVKDKYQTESSVVNCNILVEPATRPPIDVQFWSIDNRVGLSGFPVKVSNQSKPTEEVKKVAWKISTPSNPGDSPPAAKIVDGPANNSNIELHNGVMQSAFYVHIYVTNESETANCTSSSIRTSFRNGYWCKKGAIYFRLRTVTKTEYNSIFGLQRCQYDTISASRYPSYSVLKNRFWNQIKNKVWGQYSVPAMLEDHYKHRNCVRDY